MTQRQRTIFAIYASALFQGIAFITFPSAGALFTDADYHHLSDSQYGVLFLPLIIMAIIASIGASQLYTHFKMKQVLWAGLGADALAMALLALTPLFLDSRNVAFAFLMLATTSAGVGFGFTLTTLNAYAIDLFRTKADTAVTSLHVIAGLGQVFAPLVLRAFMGLGAWWGAPIFTLSALVGLILFQQTLPLNIAFDIVHTAEPKPQSKLPRFFLWFPLAAFLYGAIEGTFGNWITIYLEEDIHLSATKVALGLALFWAMITLGRVIFAFYALHHNPNPIYRAVPFTVAAACLILPMLTGDATSFIGIVLVGLTLSSFFPYTISLASNRYPEHTGLVSGALMGAIMLGSGLNTNLVGFLREDLGLPLIFRLLVVYALCMGIAANVIQHKRKI